MRDRRVLRMGLALAAVLVFLSGCAGPPARKFEEMKREPAPRAVTFGVGDVLEFRFFYAPELNDTQTVRPDGRVVLQLVGEVTVEGKTPAQVMADLKERYAKVLVKPEVAVITRKIHARRIYVGGEVRAPGPVDMPGPMTVLGAVMMAGGFESRTAAVGNVIVIRHRDGRRYGAAVDFRKALAGQEAQDFLLHPEDIVYVPKTTITQVNQWIDQHINRIIPQVGMLGSWPMGSGTLGFDLSPYRPLP